LIRLAPAVLLGCAIVFVNGCAQPEDVSAEPKRPAKVAFDGKVDASLAGTWKTAKGDSVLTMDKDGSLKIDTKFNTPKGPGSASKKGNWLVSDGKLRLRYRESDGSDSTIAYAMKTSGNTMTLSTKVPKMVTVYTRS